MDISALTSLFASLDLSVAIIAILIFAVWKMGVKLNDQANANMEQVQARCKEREDKLMEELRENRAINAQAVDTIANCVNKLENIQSDLKEIKQDVALIMVGGAHNEHSTGATG
jgi:chromosome condensin MukBEF ATPase and DNA-binding subunit MukB